MAAFACIPLVVFLVALCSLSAAAPVPGWMSSQPYLDRSSDGHREPQAVQPPLSQRVLLGLLQYLAYFGADVTDQEAKDEPGGSGSNNDSDDSGHVYFGDIILTPEQEAVLRGETQPGISAFQAFGLWPNGIVPYTINDGLEQWTQAVDAINAAIQEIERKTCIYFKPKTSKDHDYVEFYNGQSCSSRVGHTGGRQRISLGRGCWRRDTVVHEILHTLGRFHEQNRPDRDQYVQIQWNNIKPDKRNQFNKVSAKVANTQGLPYDYFSLMHYGAYDFSRNGRPTIVPKDSDILLRQLGQRKYLGVLDIKHINGIYCKSFERLVMDGRFS